VPVVQVGAPGKIGGQRVAAGEIQVQGLVRVQIQGARHDDIAVRIDHQHDVDLQLLQPDSGHIRAHELGVVICHEAVGVVPVAPVRGRQREPVQRQVDRVVDAAHRGAGVVMLEFSETGHEDAVFYEDLDHPQDHEHGGDQRDDLGAYRHRATVDNICKTDRCPTLKSAIDDLRHRQEVTAVTLFWPRLAPQQ
jgi:hypothetical protein